MDGNKDEALKCLRIGKESLASGDRPRALKFFTKARRLDPTLPVDDLLSQLEKDSAPTDRTTPDSNGPTTTASNDGANGPSSKVRRRVSATGSAADSASSSSTATYTEEQVTIVRQINKKKDYYEILGLEKTCSVDDVRKAYRKLSLKVHPDKNNAPGAEEAFKAVSKAFQCLSNEESRKKYDLTGSDEPVQERRASRYHHAGGFNGGYYQEFDADEIFRQFFFGGMPPATTQFRAFNFGGGMGHRTEGNAPGLNLRTLVQLLPVLLILLLNFLPSSEPIFSLSRSYPYEYRYTTERGVNFYVKSTKFEQDYPPDSQQRAALEAKVEREYVSILAQNCRFELQRQQWGFIRRLLIVKCLIGFNLEPHCQLDPLN